MPRGILQRFNAIVLVFPSGGADLVSCGGLGTVRLWSIQHGRLVGQFTAHNRDLGSIVMTVSSCGKYLITADGEGAIKTWNIEVGFCDPHSRIPAKTVISQGRECVLRQA